MNTVAPLCANTSQVNRGKAGGTDGLSIYLFKDADHLQTYSQYFFFITCLLTLAAPSTSKILEIIVHKIRYMNDLKKTIVTMAFIIISFSSLNLTKVSL